MGKIVIAVFLCCAVICLAQQSDDSEITKAMKKDKIIPDVIEASVPELLKVKFENNVIVNMGNEVTPFQTRNQPVLDWNADENKFYTALIVDPDAPDPDNPVNALLNTWLVGNIPGKDVKSGEVLIEYVAAATPKGAPYNRYAVLVYEQPGKLNFTEKRIDKFTFQGRAKFQLEEFALKYELGNPIAANFFWTQYDDYVLVVYTQLRCCVEFNKV